MYSAVLSHLPLLLPPPRPPPPRSRPILLSAASTTAASSAAVTLDADVNDSSSAVSAFWDYQFLFLSQRTESPTPTPLRIVEGSIPAAFPDGTYYLTGPGIFSDDHGSTVHPLDGHGYLRAFRFAEGKAMYSARYVETAAKREETEEGTGGWRFTHRGPFSVLRGGRRVGNVKVMKNVANTSVVRWGGRLLCLWEGGDPYEVDEGTLGTLGVVELVGDGGGGGGGRRRGGGVAGVLLDFAASVLKPVLQGVFHMPPKRLLSHYKIDSQRNRLLLLSCNTEDMLLPRCNFTFYEFDCNFVLKQKKEFVIHEHLMLHDWTFTDNHYVLMGNRIKLDIPGSLLAVSGLTPMISALSVNPSHPTTPIYLLPRQTDEHAASGVQRDWKVPVEAQSQLWVLHVCNAFEETDAAGNLNIQLHASVCSYSWFNFQKMFGYNWQNGKLDPSFMNPEEGDGALLPHLVQMSIKTDETGRNGVCSVTNLSKQWTKPADFPVINPDYSGRRNSYIYAGTASGSRRHLPHFPFDTVLKHNNSDGSTVSWCAGSRKFIGEPIFVPSSGSKEDDGYILVVEYAVSKQRCYLVVLDARRIGEEDAVVAKLEVPKHLNFPLGFHGFWANG